jgi:hypothetical protein
MNCHALLPGKIDSSNDCANLKDLDAIKEALALVLSWQSPRRQVGRSILRAAYQTSDEGGEATIAPPIEDYSSFNLRQYFLHASSTVSINVLH